VLYALEYVRCQLEDEDGEAKTRSVPGFWGAEKMAWRARAAAVFCGVVCAAEWMVRK
jgi:hypothetical protein